MGTEATPLLGMLLVTRRLFDGVVGGDRLPVVLAGLMPKRKKEAVHNLGESRMGDCQKCIQKFREKRKDVDPPGRRHLFQGSLRKREKKISGPGEGEGGGQGDTADAIQAAWRGKVFSTAGWLRGVSCGRSFG